MERCPTGLLGFLEETKRFKGKDMIRRIDIIQYRKLKDISLDFSPTVNAISGTNGTCKSSLLHLFSNALQAVSRKCEWISDQKCIPVINAVNSITNPKVESLTRGDREYNDPAHGKKGILFTVNYYGREPLGFRRHNSTQTTRYAVKPMYKRGTQDSLPCCPVIYLGLSRLVPFGEYQNDDAISGIKKNLPAEYQEEIARLYKDFTHYSISLSVGQQMGDIKTRAEFTSNLEGVDSNTISAGEDNLHIILTALVSLKYYYDSITSTRDVESVMLIDELDATLHPAFQIKLLHVFREFSKSYKIQIVFTTHSLSLLDTMLACHDNVLYLVDNVTDVVKMDDPDIYKIKMHLSSLTHEDIYRDKVIPVFTEDEQARFLLEHIFTYFESVYDTGFRDVRRLFHLVNINLGADSLRNIFSDSKLLRMTMQSICVLDGDHNSDLSNCITTLPRRNGGSSQCNLSPEKLLFDYAEKLYNENDHFWTDQAIISKGYGKNYYIEKIQKPLQEFEEKHTRGEETKKPREFNKELFIQQQSFFELLFKHWLHNPDNKSELDRFHNELKKLFLQVAPYGEINPHDWQ